jgi:uncharacterized protein (TIGR04255 family)
VSGIISSVAQKRQYKNPPIEEALVEFRFDGVTEDPALIFRLFEKLSAEYPQPQTQHVMSANVQMGVVGLQQSQRAQLISADAKRIFSLGPELFSVNVLRPYSGWGEFNARVERALNAYWQTAKPVGVNRVVVRYINKVALPDTVAAEVFFQGLPILPKGVPEKRTAILVRTEHAYDDGVKIVLTLAPIQPEQAFLFDIEVIWDGTGATSLDSAGAMAMAATLHEREGVIFEAMITQKAREAFDA